MSTTFPYSTKHPSLCKTGLPPSPDKCKCFNKEIHSPPSSHRFSPQNAGRKYSSLKTHARIPLWPGQHDVGSWAHWDVFALYPRSPCNHDTGCCFFSWESFKWTPVSLRNSSHTPPTGSRRTIQVCLMKWVQPKHSPNFKTQVECPPMVSLLSHYSRKTI